MKKKFLILIVCSLVFSSCMTAPSGKEKVITAYMTTGNIKYYIRPSKMVLYNLKDKSADILADFTYQKLQKDFVTDAYFNFTLNYKTDAYITKVQFLLPENRIIDLHEISLLDRNVLKSYIRVSSVIEKKDIKDVLDSLVLSKASLKVFLDNGENYEFLPTKDMINRINEAFSK